MVIAGKNMEKSGKFQVSENKLVILGETPQFPWKLPEISLWKVHKLSRSGSMEKPVKAGRCRVPAPGPVKSVNEPVTSSPSSLGKPVNTMEKPVIYPNYSMVKALNYHK
jgi:hypothetical protein